MSRQKEELRGPASDLVDAVRQQPGIHFRELARAVDISSMGQLRHHVDRLRQNGWLVEVEDGRYKRFFISGTHPPAVRQTLARFSRPVPLRIAQLLLGRPMSRGDLRRTLGCADSTLGYHLARMCIDGDIVKIGMNGRCRYALADPEAVRAALLLRTTAPTGEDGGRVTIRQEHAATPSRGTPATEATHRHASYANGNPSADTPRADPYASEGPARSAQPRTRRRPSTWPPRPPRRASRPGRTRPRLLETPQRTEPTPVSPRTAGPPQHPRRPASGGPLGTTRGTSPGTTGGRLAHTFRTGSSLRPDGAGDAAPRPHSDAK